MKTIKLTNGKTVKYEEKLLLCYGNITRSYTTEEYLIRNYKVSEKEFSKTRKALKKEVDEYYSKPNHFGSFNKKPKNFEIYLTAKKDCSMYFVIKAIED